MKRRNIYNWLMGATCLVTFSSLASCADDLEIGGQLDESDYQGVYENRAFLCDGVTGRVSNVIELYSASHTTTVRMNLSKEGVTTTSAKVAIDEAYLDTYNKLHNTEFALLPKELVTLANDGVLSAKQKSSDMEVGLEIQAGNQLEAGKTYALPLAIMDASSDITIKNEDNKHCIYLVKDMRSFGDVFKGEDKPKGFLFFEVNDVNPLNALSFQLENGKYLWDVVVLFAANINYDSEAGRPYVKCNPNVQHLLDNNETLLQPLRKRGIKVLLGLLGNHDMAGLAQLSDQGAKDFAREIAQYCYAFNLDGVNYDDEYSNAPDLSNPSFTNHSTQAAARLCYETKKAMPDKLVTVFDYGSMYGVSSVDGVDADEWIDIVVPNYGGRAYPVGNMTLKKCAGLAAEFNLGIGGSLSSSAAQNLMASGYGWFMGFAPSPKTFDSTFRRLQGARELYGSPLKEPTIYYKKNDPNPSVYPDDNM